MTTLKNVTSVLRLFRDNRRELSVDDVRRLMSMPKSSAARLLASMRDESLLESVGRPPRYRIGPLFLEVAGLHRSFLSSSLNDLADAALVDLCETTGYTGYVSILQGADVLVVRVRRGSYPLQVVTPLGYRLQAFETAIGRALLSRLSDDEIRRRHPGKLSPSSPHSPQSLSAVLRLVAQAREDGFAESCNEALPGIGSLAISLRSADVNELVGVCLSYPSSITSQKEKKRMSELLLATGRKIGTDIGDDFWVGRRNGDQKMVVSFGTNGGGVALRRGKAQAKRALGG